MNIVGLRHVLAALIAIAVTRHIQVLNMLRLTMKFQPRFGLPKAVIFPIILRLNFLSAWKKTRANSTSRVTSRDSHVFLPSLPSSPTISSDNYPATNVGVLFFPGATVEAIAYAPLLENLAQQAGVTVICARLPFRISTLWPLKKTLNVMKRHPSIHTWILGGHSWGAGSLGAAGMVLELRRRAQVQQHKSLPISMPGLFMLAGSITGDDVDLSNESGLECLAILASEDTIVPPVGNGENGVPVIDGIVGKCPKTSTKIIIIQGGNHAGFGHYGPQTFPLADGERKISHEMQQKQTVDHLVPFVRKIVTHQAQSGK